MPKGYVIARAVVTNASQWAVYAAEAYAYSPEYAAARKLREGAGHIDIVCVEGA